VKFDTPQARIFPFARRLSNAGTMLERLRDLSGQC